MTRRLVILFALIAGALVPAVAAVGAARASVAPPARASSAVACATVAPAGLRLAVDRDGAGATLRWRIPAGHPPKLSFRVARDGAVVGQTSARQMRVSLAPSRAATITVTAVLRGARTRCHATVHVRGKGPAPAAVQGLSTTLHRGGRVTLSWEPPMPGAHPVRGYRLRRDGRTAATLKHRSVTLRVPAHGTQRLQLAVLDTAGHVGPWSSTVTLKAGHVPPKPPVAPAASDVTSNAAALSWGRARAFGARIAGYRLVRDGRTVQTTKSTVAQLTKLPLAQSHTYRIVAVDTLGWTSEPSQSVKVTTGRRAPASPAVPGSRGAPGPPGAPRATAVGDTSVSLAWDASALPAGSQLRGYRLMRDGEVITQVTAQSADVGNLAPKSTHDWTVAAVDTQGQASAPSPATRVVQSDPPPTTGGVHAYLLASTDASFAAFREHYRQIGVVYPTFFDCNAASGLIEGTNNPAIVSFAQDRKVKVMPRFYCQRTAILHRILTDPAMREQWLQTTVDMVDQNGWDGVNIDFEAAAATDRDALTSFMAELSDRLHAQGKLLSQAVSAKVRDIPDHPRSGVFDYPALAQYDDYIFVMAWGVHWATSAPGAQDDLTWVRQIRDYVATMPQKQKFVMGTMLYGMDWPAGGGPDHGGQGLQYSEIQALAGRFGAASVFDPTQDSWHLTYTDDAGVPHDVWYSDAAAVGDRVALAREQGLGVGFWRIGQEDEAIWSDPRLPAAG